MKLKRIIAMLATVAMMATMMFGCGQPADSKTTEAPDNKTTEAPGVDGTTEAPTDAKPVYPLEGNPTVTIWGGGLSNNVAKSCASLEERPYAQQLMKNTGINIDWIMAGSSGTATDEFNFMIAEGNYTDMFSAKASAAVQYHADGVIIALNDVIDQYMPNFKTFLEANPDVEKIIRNDDGNIYYIPSGAEDPAMGNTYGGFARQDWMEEMGVETPKTIDEWHDLLVRVKNEKGIYPLVGLSSTLFQYGAFVNAYCPDLSIASGYYAEDGEVFYIPATDEYREFLRTMHQWYEEGLLHKDFASMKGSVWRALMAGDEGFVTVGFCGSGLMNITNTGIQSNPDFLFTAVPTPALSDGEEPRYQSATARFNTNNGGMCISTKCENVEAAARLLDYYWTEEGYMLNNYGIEGTSYTMVDGKPVYTDLILRNPDGLAVNEAKAPYMINFEGSMGLGALEALKGYYSATPGASDAMEIWASEGEIDHTITRINQTLEEAELISIYQADINTYMTSCRDQFVLGTMDIETQWDEYLQKLEEFKLQRVIELKQAALDRYLEK